MAILLMMKMKMRYSNPLYVSIIFTGTNCNFCALYHAQGDDGDDDDDPHPHRNLNYHQPVQESKDGQMFELEDEFGGEIIVVLEGEVLIITTESTPAVVEELN